MMSFRHGAAKRQTSGVSAPNGSLIAIDTPRFLSLAQHAESPEVFR